LSDFTKDKGELWNVLSEIVEVIENNCGWWKLSSTTAEKDEDVIAVSEYATTEKGLKRTDLLMSSIVSSEPIKSVSSSLHTQHPMSFDKVVRITSSSFSAVVEDNFHQPQLFSNANAL
jgi:hypothetical protein